MHSNRILSYCLKSLLKYIQWSKITAESFKPQDVYQTIIHKSTSLLQVITSYTDNFRIHEQNDTLNARMEISKLVFYRQQQVQYGNKFWEADSLPVSIFDKKGTRMLSMEKKKNKSRALRDANTMKTFPQHILFLYSACEHRGLFQEIPFCLFTLILNMLAEKQRNNAHHTHHLFLLSYRELAVSANTDKTY